MKNAMTQALLAVETGGATPDDGLGRRRQEDRQPGRLMTSNPGGPPPARRPGRRGAPPPAAGARPATARGAPGCTPRRPARAPYAYVAPFFAIFLAFGLFPLVYTAWISLHRYRLGIAR